jgi:hypothetical protein
MTLGATRRLVVVLCLALCAVPTAPTATATAAQAPGNATLTLPRMDGSVRFAVMGDTGTGEPGQYELANQMAASHHEFPFDFVIMLGDNIIGADSPDDMANKFTTPYKPLLDAGVVFHAVLGNHDNPSQRFYELFNMGGERYYAFQAAKGGTANPAEGGVRFIALDSDYLDTPQIDWLEKELSSSSLDWKMGGIVYWVSGAGGRLRSGNLRASDMTAKGFDSDNHFMIVEISGDDLYYQAISRTGETVDSGVVHRPGAPAAASAAGIQPSPSPTPES